MSTCEPIIGKFGREDLEAVRDPAEVGTGTILHFPHEGSGRVLVTGASVTPWAR